MSLSARLPPFTGTPIEKTDANMRAVFGDLPSQALRECRPLPFECALAQVVISIYDIQRAVADKATVPIYYESRVAKLGLNQSELPKIDEEFEAIIPQLRDEELTRKEKLKTKWAALEALVGNPKRIDLTVRPTSKLTPVRRPSPSLVLPRRRATRCRARRRCEPSGGSASWPGGRRCNQAGDRSQSRRR